MLLLAKRQFVRLMTLLLVGLFATVTVNSQTAVSPDEFVWAAFEKLSRSDHRYVVETNLQQALTEPDAEATTRDFVIRLEAEVAANGDYRAQRTYINAPDETITVEWGQIDGERYHWISEEVAQMINITAGVWLEEDLIATYETNFSIDFYLSLTQYHPLQALLPNPGVIRQVTELDSAEIDGRALRVFDVEVDSRLIWLLDQTGGSLEALAELMLNPTPPDYESNYDLRLRAWIGADDGRLYRLEADEVIDTTLPDLTISEVLFSVYTLAYPDEPIIIEANPG